MQEQHHPHIDPRPHLPATPAALTQDILGRFLRPAPAGALLLSGLLLVLGLVGFGIRLAGGFEHRVEWAYYAATFVWVLSTAQAAPIIAVATRLTKGYWRKPMVRAAELFTVAGIFNFLMMLPLLGLIPPLEGRRTFWVAWEGAPQASLLVGMFALVLCGLGLLYASALPDIAQARDYATGGRRGLLAWLARGWSGTPQQWKMMSNAITYLGIFYLMMLVTMHFLVSVEFAITLVPGWRDPIFPAYHAISSLQAGLATIILALGLYRAFGYRNYLALDQFWNPAKLLMSFSLLWFYFFWSGFIVFWYGRTPAERGVLQTEVFGPYLGAFVMSFLFNFVFPLLLLIWNPIRTSIKGPIVASVIILIGNFFDRVRIYAGSFSVENPVAHELEAVPATHLPDIADVLLVLGAIGGVTFLYLLAKQVVPPVSLWEVKEGQLLTRARSLIRSHVVVIGKPD